MSLCSKDAPAYSGDKQAIAGCIQVTFTNTISIQRWFFLRPAGSGIRLVVRFSTPIPPMFCRWCSRRFQTRWRYSTPASSEL